jgi:DNA-binding Xre family transcriptional regulator
MVGVRARDVISTAETVTPAGIAHLSKIVLQVNKENVYADFVAGAGLSTLTIVPDKETKIITSEINAECAAVAAMLYIMAGYKDISITVENSLIDKDLKRREFAEKAGISDYTLVQMNKGKKIQPVIIERICSTLGCTPNEIMEFETIE